MTTTDLSPEQLVNALTDAGWQELDSRGGQVVLAIVDAEDVRQHVMLTLDESQQADAVVKQLEVLASDGDSARQVLRRIDPALYL